MSARTARRRLTIHQSNPKPPSNRYIDSEPPRIEVGVVEPPAFTVRSGGGDATDEVVGKGLTVDDAVAVVLEHAHCNEPWLEGLVIWSRDVAVALVRALPYDARRVVFRFDGAKVSRAVYPAHPLFTPGCPR